jgi:hypothetical protein
MGSSGGKIRKIRKKVITVQRSKIRSVRIDASVAEAGRRSRLDRISGRMRSPMRAGMSVMAA